MAEKNQEFSARLRGLLKDRGITQKALAEALSVRPATVNSYCKDGRVPEWNNLVEIAQLLNISCDWLLTGNESVLMKEARAKQPRGTPQIKPEERRLLDDALDVLRAQGQDAEYGDTLKQTIRSLKKALEAQKKIPKPRSKRVEKGRG